MLSIKVLDNTKDILNGGIVSFINSSALSLLKLACGESVWMYTPFWSAGTSKL